ncbi:tetratricopeptide repeat protein [Thermodesulfobacteriota bacterium]
MATATVYWPVGAHDFVYFDDDLYVTENEYVRKGFTPEGLVWSFTDVKVGNWHPLTWLSHMLDIELYGQHPGGHHLMSAGFHILNALLLFFVFKCMTGAMWQSGLVAALFALHPLNVESVAWVAQRKSVLCTFFWMLCLGSYALYVEKPRFGRYLLVIICFLMGGLTKPMIITLPFVLILLDYWPLGRCSIGNSIPTDPSSAHQRSVAFLVREKVPLLVFALVLAAVALIDQQGSGALGSLETYPISVRMGNALISYAGYIVKMIFPHDLAFLYPYPDAILLWQIAGAMGLLVGISILAVCSAKRHPWFLVGWLWYLGTMVPVIGLVQVGAQAMADRYAYIPFIGLFIIISWGISEIAARRPNWRTQLFFLAAAVLLILMAVTGRQVRYWANSIALFERALAVTADNYIAHNNLGVVLAEQGRTAEAMAHLREALRIKPDYPDARGNLNTLLGIREKIDNDIAKLHDVLAVHPQEPLLYDTLGNLYKRKGEFPKAIAAYQKALSFQSTYLPALNDLGLTHALRGNYKDAIICFKRSVAMHPDAPDAYYYLAGIYARQNQIADSLGWLKQAVQKGFNDWELLRTDPNLENIKDSTTYQRIADEG